VAYFELIGEITSVEVIALGRGVRRARALRRRYGGRRWRKLRGEALVVDELGHTRRAELHWYEANGVGRRGLKLKRFLDELP
jgi:hypothetical protein